MENAESQPSITLKDVAVKQGYNPVLEDVSFEVKPGELVYLMGKTGSGKSTLLRMLYADLLLTEGTANVSNWCLENIKKKKIPYFRRNIGIVFQDFQLLTDRTVKDNLKFVLKATGWKNNAEIDERIATVLKMVHLYGFEGKNPYELSGGEQQRVAIARALLNAPKIILADEPTGNLDPETSSKIMEVIVEIAQKDCAIIMATHDVLLVNQFPGRILKCDAGKITEVVAN